MRTPSPTKPITLLAESGKYSPYEVMFWLGVIVALAVVLGVVAMALRKRMLAKDEAPPLGFTLKDLRRLHAEGQLSDEELAQAEARTLARTRSHYLGAQGQSGEGESAGDVADAPESSTSDPPPGDAGAENNGADTDKNSGGGSAV